MNNISNSQTPKLSSKITYKNIEMDGMIVHKSHPKSGFNDLIHSYLIGSSYFPIPSRSCIVFWSSLLNLEKSWSLGWHFVIQIMFKIISKIKKKRLNACWLDVLFLKHIIETRKSILSLVNLNLYCESYLSLVFEYI